MILIKKGSEPLGLQNHKTKSFATYDNLDEDVKNQIRVALLAEQGHLCAYCMKKIKINNMKIEHYISQNPPNEKSLDYSNMLGVCTGNMGSGSENKTCDTHRSVKNEALTINPLNRGSIAKITYTIDGAVDSKDANIKYDITKILNLNQKGLANERKSALHRFQKSLMENMPKQGNWNRDKLLRLKDKYLSVNNGNLQEYVGIIVYFIDKKLR